MSGQGIVTVLGKPADQEDWSSVPKNHLACAWMPVSFLFFFFNFFGVELIYNVVSVSIVQQSESVITYIHYVFPGRSAGKEYACNAGDPGLIHALGRSPGKGNGWPLQYSCLENSRDRGA